MNFLSYLINGISLGSVYAIIALGYTMVYGIAKMLNFAHGDVIMIGCYVVFLAMNGQGWPPLVAVVLSVIVCTVLGIVIEKIAYKPLRRATPLGRIDYSDRCQLLFTECRTVIIRCRHKVLYKCCNTAVLKTCRWKSYNLRNHDRDGSCLCHHHGWSDDFYQKNKSRTGDACCF